MTAFRFRRVRLTEPDWLRRDSGPLLAKRRSDGKSAWWHFGLTRYRTAGMAPGDDIDLAAPYPRATPGPLGLDRWIAPWKAETPRAAKPLDFAAQLVWLVPGLLVLMPSDHRLILAFALGLAALLLRRTGLFRNLRTQRSENLAIHSRLWDRMIDLPPGLLHGPARQQSATLSSGLDAALAHAECRRRAPVFAALAVTATALAVLVDQALATVLIAVTVACAAIAGLFAKTLASRRLAAIPASVELHRQRGWTLGNMIELRSLGAAASFIAALRDGTETSLDQTLGLKHAQMADMMATGWALILGISCVTFAWLVGIGDPTPRDALAVLLFSVPVLHAVTELARLYGAVLAQKPALDAILPITQFDPGTSATTAVRLDSIALESIAFSYPHSVPLFENLSLSIERGEVLALSGPSGGGKSTLLRIIMGLVPPSSGTIAVNGAPISPALRSAFSARIAAVFQDQDLGFSTIRTAVLQDMPGADLADAWSALDATGLGQAVRAMPMGIQTLLVAGAFPFSLTRQVLIARALVQNPDLLVLDETLSALDAETVGTIIDAARACGAMVIYSTHRSELLRFADRIIPLGPQHQL